MASIGKNTAETLQESLQDEHEPHIQNPPPLIPTASISLSISALLPPHLLPPKQVPTNPLNKIKLPSQIASLAQTSQFSVSLPKSRSKSTISATPLQNSLTLNPLRPANPSSAAALRRAAVVWFRNDLRIHDNECLTAANNESFSVLPVYCFDPRDYGKSSTGFDKTGPYRAKFVIESVSDLRRNLQARGSDLVVRIGRPETILPEMVKAVGADAVYVHREVSHDEVKAEEKIEAAMKDEGVEVKYYWGSTLYHLDDLPFDLERMPTNYGGFKEKVKSLQLRKTIQALDRLKGLPKRGGVEAGEIPSLLDLGLNPNANSGQVGLGRTAASGIGCLAGGETEALKRLTSFVGECKANPNKGFKDGTNHSIFGASFSCKISPWLAIGCISPRSMLDELNKSASSLVPVKNGGSGTSDKGINWLTYQLLWRDFFRFITKKCRSAKQQNHAPLRASTGAAVCA